MKKETEISEQMFVIEVSTGSLFPRNEYSSLFIVSEDISSIVFIFWSIQSKLKMTLHVFRWLFQFKVG